MSKKAKLVNREKRLQSKRAKKSANKARYLEMKARGVNSKSKRSVSNSKKKKRVSLLDHPNGNCGNPGCLKCFPYLERRLKVA